MVHVDSCVSRHPWTGGGGGKRFSMRYSPPPPPKRMHNFHFFLGGGGCPSFVLLTPFFRKMRGQRLYITLWVRVYATVTPSRNYVPWLWATQRRFSRKRAGRRPHNSHVEPVTTKCRPRSCHEIATSHSTSQKLSYVALTWQTFNTILLILGLIIIIMIIIVIIDNDNNNIGFPAHFRHLFIQF